MKMLIVSSQAAAELEALNASGDPSRQLRPASLAGSRLALNADLLEDSGPGQTWEHYARVLAGLPQEEVTELE
jgi:hypothetical protein